MKPTDEADAIERLEIALSDARRGDWSSARRNAGDAEFHLRMVESRESVNRPYRGESLFSCIGMGFMVVVGIVALIGWGLVGFIPLFAAFVTVIALIIGIPINLYLYVLPQHGSGWAWVAAIISFALGVVLISVGVYVYEQIRYKDHWPIVRFFQAVYEDW